LLLLFLFLAACASTQSVDLEESRRVVGTESDVRIDAQIFGEKLTTAARIPMKYDITNERAAPIAIADIIPVAEYDPDTQTVTVTIGSEVPGNQLLPRLLTVMPGEKKTFDTVARVNILVNRAATPNSRFPNGLRVKVNFLSDTEPFKDLIGISERAVENPQLADVLFPVWLENNETVYTNTLPMRWMFEPEAEPTQRRRSRRGR
ncbi:MAG TPA: hypothetical protein VF057_01535, partial [Thermoanaerobaculia bacterium]